MLDLKQIVLDAVQPVDEGLVKMAEELEGFQGLTDRESYIYRLGKALGDSLPVINIEDALRAGGFDPDKRWPRLAITYASADIASVFAKGDGSFYFGVDHITVEDMAPINKIREWFIGGKRWRADVPLIPAQIRPHTLSGYRILFEPVWQSVPRIADPYLLERVVGVYYKVVASWEVTDLEIRALRAARI